MIVTNSSLTTFKSCPRKYQIRYIKGYAPSETKTYLTFGTNMHKLIELWYTNGKNLELAKKQYLVNANELKSEDMVPLQMIDGYAARYAVEGYESLQCEARFEFDLYDPKTNENIDGVKVNGMMDGLMTNIADGKVILRETKTTSEDISSSFAPYWEKLKLDSQVSTYLLAVHETAKECLYDVVKKPLLKQKKEELFEEYLERIRLEVLSDLDKYFVRKVIHRSDSEILENLKDMVRVTKMIQDCEGKSNFPRYTNSCFSFNSKCPYYDVCCGWESLEDKTKFVKNDDVFGELKK